MSEDYTDLSKYYEAIKVFNRAQHCDLQRTGDRVIEVDFHSDPSPTILTTLFRKFFASVKETDKEQSLKVKLLKDGSVMSRYFCSSEEPLKEEDLVNDMDTWGVTSVRIEFA